AARLQVAGAAWWLRDLDGLPALLRQALGAGEVPHGVRRLQAALQLIQSQARIAQLVEGFARTGAVPPV
ncbi:glycosyl transferase, partial [Xanthomonas perforans]